MRHDAALLSATASAQHTTEWYTLTQTRLVVTRVPSFAEWQGTGVTLSRLRKSLHFWIGDWLAYGVEHFPDLYSQALDETGFDYQTLVNDKSVCSRLAVRSDKLTFTHHALIAGLSPERQQQALKAAVDQSMTTKELGEYVRNLNGKHPARNIGKQTAQYAYLVPPIGVCCLKGFVIDCDGPLTGQHIISKQMARGNDAVRDILRRCDDEIMSDVCYAHNVGKLADSREARKILLLQKIMQYGFAHMQQYIDGEIGQHWKLKEHCLTLVGMLE